MLAGWRNNQTGRDLHRSASRESGRHRMQPPPSGIFSPLLASTLHSVYNLVIFVRELSALVLPQQPGRTPLAYNKGKSIVIHTLYLYHYTPGKNPYGLPIPVHITKRSWTTRQPLVVGPAMGRLVRQSNCLCQLTFSALRTEKR